MKGTNMRISVKIKEVGGYNGPVVIEEGSTVRDALRTAGVNTETAKTIRKNNEDADLSTILRDGDLVYVVPNIKGNS